MNTQTKQPAPDYGEPWKKRESWYQSPLQELKECHDRYVEMCTNLQECVQKHDIGLEGEKLDTLVCDEIQAMRDAIAEVNEHARWLAANTHGLSYRTAQAITTRLRPFVKATQ